MSSSCSLDAAMNEQNNSAAAASTDLQTDSPNSSRNIVKLPKIFAGNALPLNIDSNYDDLNKFSNNVQM